MSGLRKIRITYTIYVLLCLIFIWISVDGYAYNMYFFGQIYGLLGVLLFSLQFLLTSRLKFMDRLWGYANIVSVHKLNAKIAFTLIVLHPLLLYSFSFSNYFSALKDYSIFGFMGPFALTLFFVIIVTSIFRKKLKLRYETWRKIHLITYVAVTAGFVHGYFLGEHVAHSLYLYWYLAHLAMVLGVLFYRFYWVKRHLSQYEVISVRAETDEIYTVSMEPIGKKLVHKAGQFAFVRFYSKSLPSEEHHFTISSAPEDKLLTFSIEAYGDYTKKISTLKKGDKAMIEGPFGDLVLDGSDEYLFVAGGIGITPIVSMIRDQYSSKSAPSPKLRTASIPRIKLLYSGKKLKDMAFVEELKKISRSGAIQIEFFTTELRESGANYGRISDQVLHKAYKSMKSPSVYVVGPMSLISLVESSLRSKSVKKELFEFN